MDADSPEEPDLPTDPLHPKEQASAVDPSSVAAAAAADANSLQQHERLVNGEVTANGEGDAEATVAANGQGSQAHAMQLSGKKRSAAAAELGGLENGAALAPKLDGANAADAATANGHVEIRKDAADGPPPNVPAAETTPEVAANEAVNGDGMANDADADGKMLEVQDPTDGVPIEPDPNSVAVDK